MSYAYDPELAPFVELIPRSDFSNIEASRANLASLIAPLNAEVDTTGITIDDRAVPGPDGAPSIPVRVYAPADAHSAARPGLLDIHGGGFCSGSIEMEHAIAVRIVRDLGAVVVVVEYRLAPRAPVSGGRRRLLRRAAMDAP